MSIISLNKIEKYYGEKVILKDFSIKVDSGEFVAIMGPSGSGKSTLLNIIGLIEDFDDGELIVDGQVNILPNSLKSNRLLRNKISYLFQNYALVEEETVEKNISMALKYVKAHKKEKKKMLNDSLRYVGLEDMNKKRIYQLSGGEQQRVAIARIMLKPSKIILADEPTGSLDESNRDIVLNLLKKLNNQGKTIIIVTHDKYVANSCHRIIRLD